MSEKDGKAANAPSPINSGFAEPSTPASSAPHNVATPTVTSASSSDQSSVMRLRVRRISELSSPSTSSRRHVDKKLRFESEVPDQYGPRVGIPRLSPHPPIFEDLLSHEYPEGWTADYMDDTDVICKDAAVRYESFGLKWRAARYEQLVEKDLCFTIFSYLTEAERWPSLCRNVHQFLSQKGVEVAVEIIDWDRSINEWNFPLISPLSPMVPAWQELRPQVLDILQGHKWQTMTIYGTRADNKVPVIVLRVWEPRNGVWLAEDYSSVTSKISKLCVSRGIPTEVIVGQAYEVRQVSGNNPGKADLAPEYFEKLFPGAGLELKHNFQGLGPGTFGGHFLLKADGEADLAVGLTNYHVARHEVLINKDVDRLGIPLATQIIEPIVLQSPINRDSFATEGKMRNELQESMQARKLAEQQVECCLDEIELQQRLAKAKEYEAYWKETLRSVQAASPRAGELVAAGGYRIHKNGWPLDWALIETPVHRIVPNKVSLSPLKYVKKEGIIENIRTEDIEPELRVFKIGHKTGFSVGTISHIKADIKLEGMPLCTAWVAKGSTEQAFADPGDSGALVWDKDGDWCGLIFGGSRGENCGYFIPANVIVEDVKAMTRRDLVLPPAAEVV